MTSKLKYHKNYTEFGEREYEKKDLILGQPL